MRQTWRFISLTRREESCKFCGATLVGGVPLGENVSMAAIPSTLVPSVK